MRTQKELVKMLDGFYTLLRQMIDANTPYSDAREIIDAMYEPEDLSGLLEMEHDHFESLRSLAHHPALKNLLFYFCQLNPRIVHKPFHGMVDDEALLQIFESNPQAFAEILGWLSTHTKLSPPNKEIAEYQNQLATLARRRNFIKFIDILNSLPENLMTDIIHQKHAEFLDKVMSAPVEFLELLVQKDPSILQARVYDERILNILCEAPEYNHRILSTIQKRFMESLSKSDQVLIQEALIRVDSRCSDDDDDDDDDDEMVPFSISESSELMASKARDAFDTSNPLLTSKDMRTMVADKEFTPELMKYVNLELDIESPVMDVFLFRTLWEKLALKGIALLPTASDLEPISAQRFIDIKTPRKTFTYMTGLSVVDGELIPVFEEISFPEPIRYVAIPTHSHRHYGLLIFDLMADVLHGIYIEPLSVSSILIGDDNVGLDPIQNLYLAMQKIMASRVSPMLIGSGYENHLLSVLFLSQHSGQHYCSDNIIAILNHIASPEFELTNNLLSLTNLQFGNLPENFVLMIRMLQIHMHGLDYFKLQLRGGLTPEDVTRAIDLFHQNTQLNSIRWLERVVFGAEIANELQKCHVSYDTDQSLPQVKRPRNASSSETHGFFSPAVNKKSSRTLLQKVLINTSLQNRTLPPQCEEDMFDLTKANNGMKDRRTLGK